MKVNHRLGIVLECAWLFQQHQTLSQTVAITNFGFGQKGAIVKITAISGFASCDVNGLTAVALRAHAFIHQIPTGCWVFLLVHHGGENVGQGAVSLRARTLDGAGADRQSDSCGRPGRGSNCACDLNFQMTKTGTAANGKARKAPLINRATTVYRNLMGIWM